MYLTAHRIRTAEGATGINSFLYLHPTSIDPSDALDVLESVDSNPGMIAFAKCEYPIGHNDILAYVDIVSDNHVRRQELISALKSAQSLAGDTSAVPFKLAVGPVAIRFGATRGMIRSGNLQTEYDLLCNRALSVFDEKPRPPWFEAGPLKVLKEMVETPNDIAEVYRLDNDAVRRLRKRHGNRWLPRRFTVELGTKEEFERDHSEMIPIVINALTDLSPAEVIEMGGVVIEGRGIKPIRWPPRPE